MLTVRDLHAYYGKSHILQGVNLEVRAGEIVSLLGRNGVGRSTTCKAIMGLVEPVGEVLWKGKSIAGLRPDLIAQAGIGYVPEDRQVFPTLTVRQNLELGLKRAGRFGRSRDPRAINRWMTSSRISDFPPILTKVSFPRLTRLYSVAREIRRRSHVSRTVSNRIWNPQKAYI